MRSFVSYKTPPVEDLQYNVWKREHQSWFGMRVNGCAFIVTKALVQAEQQFENN